MKPEPRAVAAILAFCFVVVVAPRAASAAQDSTVIVDNAPITVEPNKKSKVMEYLALGSEVRISSYPLKNGWYKIRATNGVYGWIHESALSVFKPEEDAREDEYQGPRPERDRKWFLRLLGGFDFFRPDDINDLFAFDELNTGYQVGGELGFFLSERLAAVFRTEAIVKDVSAKETFSGLPFTLGLRSYPVMIGMDFYFAKLPAMRISLGVFGGMALATSFAAEATTLNDPNTVTLQRSPFTTLARVNVTRPMGRMLSVFVEVGYRYLRTDEISTVIAADINGGQQVFTKEGIYKTRTIDLSGAVLAAGIGVHF